MAKDRNKTIPIRTGLTEHEFEEVLELLERQQEPIKRGRHLLEKRIRLVILLQWLHHGQTFKKLGESMDLTHSCVQTAIASIWDPLTSVLFETYVPANPYSYNCNEIFQHHPDAIGAVDATLIMIRKPKERAEDHAYFSGKHRRHGVKLQIMVAPDGRCIHYGGVICGSRNDFYLFEHSTLPHDLSRANTLPNGEVIIERRPILADGGYLGIRKVYSGGIIPHRKPPGGRLTDQQRLDNMQLSSDRVIVERFFGRMKAYWAILQRPYRCDRDSVDSLAKLVVSLTNLKLRTAPLVADEPLYDPAPSVNEEEEEIAENSPTQTQVQAQTPIRGRRQTQEQIQQSQGQRRTSQTRVSNQRQTVSRRQARTSTRGQQE